ncbi:unnamed protein product [Blepharisma stoltei]|uniref:Uncharacterized protein n=1 Tax=Blepharisma stoltei TaxID=1481888 RepID=A0AAU9J746_9CILI|nr:unnamed protein product [Blepharisma stoltei]
MSHEEKISTKCAEEMSYYQKVREKAFTRPLKISKNEFSSLLSAKNKKHKARNWTNCFTWENWVIDLGIACKIC